MKIATLLLTFLFITLGYCQKGIGFLKAGVGRIYIKDIEYATQPPAILPANVYFEILTTDSSKFKIMAVCKPPCHTGFAAPCRNSYTTFVDSSCIIQFNNLPLAEKRTRITTALDYYTAVLKTKPVNTSKFELAEETIYEPIREEFVKYWLTWKDDGLLSKWFNMLYYDDGSADEMQSTIVAKLFCEGTDDFMSTLLKQPKKIKDYIVYRLADYAFEYYAVHYFPLDGQTENRVTQFIKLRDSRLMSLH